MRNKVHIYEELWKIRNPHLSRVNKQSLKLLINQVVAQCKKDPPSKLLPLPLSKKAVFDLTTARNRNLITIDQQHLLRTTPVAFFGMSVGSHAALTWMMQSRADHITIADPDTVDASNLNRLRFGWSQVGKFKIDVVASLLYDINPFTRITASRSTQPAEVEKLISRKPPARVIVDEIDSFEAKVWLRKLAKKYKLPLVSAADIGDNVVLDIERYDLTPSPEHFLGRIPEADRINFAKLSPLEKKKLIIRLVGFEHNSLPLLDSILAIGGSVPTWPQLGATATISGGIVATTIKKIILGENVSSGRYFFSLDDILVRDYHTPDQTTAREKKVSLLKHLLQLE